MILTPWDYIEVLAVAALAVYALGSSIRFAACSTVFALVVFHICARYYIGNYGSGIESAMAVGFLGGVIGAAHLSFDYSWRGLATGIAFALVPIFAGAAVNGWIPIVYQMGPGVDFWTLVSLSAWGVWLVLFLGIMRARHVAG